jgi:hypothetical protein
LSRDDHFIQEEISFGVELSSHSGEVYFIWEALPWFEWTFDFFI